jgi:hypothetical protein
MLFVYLIQAGVFCHNLVDFSENSSEGHALSYVTTYKSISGWGHVAVSNVGIRDIEQTTVIHNRFTSSHRKKDMYEVVRIVTQ